MSYDSASLILLNISGVKVIHLQIVFILYFKNSLGVLSFTKYYLCHINCIIDILLPFNI